MDAKIISLTCPNCAAKLQIQGEMSIAKCSHCDRQFLINRGGSEIWLSPLMKGLEQVKLGSDNMAIELALTRLREEITYLNQTVESKKQDLITWTRAHNSALALEKARKFGNYIKLLYGAVAISLIGFMALYQNGRTEIAMLCLITTFAPFIGIALIPKLDAKSIAKYKQNSGGYDSTVTKTQMELSEQELAAAEKQLADKKNEYQRKYSLKH